MMRDLLCSAFLALLCVLILGCESDVVEEEIAPPEILGVFSPGGWGISSDATIIVEFSKVMDSESVIIALDGETVSATSRDGRKFEFTLGKVGEFELTIQGNDIDGNELEPRFIPFKINVDVMGDTTPPRILHGECSPENGYSGVDPAAHMEGLVIAFSEPMAEVTVIEKSPDFLSEEELSEDRTILNIRFLRYTMPTETIFRIKLDGRDLAGNKLYTDTYSFITLAMENGYSPVSLFLLFSISVEYQIDLDNQRISEKLRQEFEVRDFILYNKSNVSVGKKGLVWLIGGGGAIYYLAKDGDEIDVYSTSLNPGVFPL